MSTSDIDPFWVQNRAEFLAKMSVHADPNACGTCHSLAADGKPVQHDECQQRATLLQAPDHPYYEILAGFSLEENEKLPARFHIPVFDDCGVPNSWHCAVCWEDGVVTGWPCKTAMEQGTKVFSPSHDAETAQKRQQAENAELKAEIARLREELTQAVRVANALNRRLSEEQLAGSALYAALTMPTTDEQRQAALDKFQAVAQQVTR